MANTSFPTAMESLERSDLNRGRNEPTSLAWYKLAAKREIQRYCDNGKTTCTLLVDSWDIKDQLCEFLKSKGYKTQQTTSGIHIYWG